MAEAVVSAVVDKLISIASDQIQKEQGLFSNVRKLSLNFKAIRAVLEDAEWRQLERGTSVGVWFDKLKEVSYDIEDVLDEWNTAILQSKLEPKVHSFIALTYHFIPLPYCCFNRGKLSYKTAHKIKALRGRLDDIATERQRYGSEELRSFQRPSREENTSFINLSEVFCRVAEKQRMVHMLLDDKVTLGSGIHMISIAGTEALGKTTLAQLALNDESVQSHFELRIWVNVSVDFDEMRIAKEIFKSIAHVGEEALDQMDSLDYVLQRLKDSIKEKKFLLVLDDVWNEKPEKWDQLKLSLNYGSQASKIIVTTRKQTVASVMGCTTSFLLNKLTEEESWSFFCQQAFRGMSVNDPKYLALEDIGKAIVNRCNGLPLAVKTIASLMMHSRKTIAEWESVLNSELWSAGEGLFGPLMLSYHNLSSHLKQCFLFCAIFPKDYVIEKNKLIDLWMANGFLKADPGQDAEKLGERCFNELAMFFFQDFEKGENGSIIKCKMDGMVRKSAIILSGRECLTMESKDSIEGFGAKARHMMLMHTGASTFPTCIYNAEKLRTWLIESAYRRDYHMDLQNFFDKLRCLRALKCDPLMIKKFPKLVQKWIHLRYIDLSKNRDLEELPETVCDLYNLLILDVSGCWKLRRLPSRMGNLINLHHLRNEETYDLSFLPRGIEKLTCLQTLSWFVVQGDGEGAALSELGNLINLRGRLEISGLGNVRDEEEAEKAKLQDKEGLIDLSLIFGLPDERQVSQQPVDVLKALQPPPELETLEIKFYASPTTSHWPSWMLSLTKLKKLELSWCHKVNQLPSLGQLPSLESLTLKSMEDVENVGFEFLGIGTSLSPSSSSLVAFPSLKSLSFQSMEEWKGWHYGSQGEDITIMPHLSSLEIVGCRKLAELPIQIRQNTVLQRLRICRSPIIIPKLQRRDYLPHISRTNLDMEE